jgi:hypothetical protein
VNLRISEVAGTMKLFHERMKSSLLQIKYGVKQGVIKILITKHGRFKITTRIPVALLVLLNLISYSTADSLRCE